MSQLGVAGWLLRPPRLSFSLVRTVIIWTLRVLLLAGWDTVIPNQRVTLPYRHSLLVQILQLLRRALAQKVGALLLLSVRTGLARLFSSAVIQTTPTAITPTNGLGLLMQQPAQALVCVIPLHNALSQTTAQQRTEQNSPVMTQQNQEQQTISGKP